MKHIALFSVAFLFSAIFVSEAEARKSRFFVIPGFGGGETIDLVYDLPDREPFLRNGEAFDIGYLNSGDRSGYVLYRGERYGRLSDADIARLNAVFGGLTPIGVTTALAINPMAHAWYLVFIAVLAFAIGLYLYLRGSEIESHVGIEELAALRS